MVIIGFDSLDATGASVEYHVYYRSGGTLNFQWRPVLGTHNQTRAKTYHAELLAAGYPSLLIPKSVFGQHGTPTAFEPEKYGGFAECLTRTI